MLEIYLVLGFMIVAAIVAVEIKDMISSVVAVGAVGLGLSVAFLLLKAPDLAITQLSVEIVVLVILIRATVRKDIASNGRKVAILATLGIAFVLVFLAIAHLAIKELPEFGNPIMRIGKNYLAYGLQRTGATNLVGSVILDFRAFDTLGEATVLFTAVIGALAVLRKIGRKKLNQKVKPEDE